MSSLYPSFFARFYDLLYSKILTGKDLEYYLEKIRESDGPILEAGTGTGRLFIRALNLGADIHGIDISPEMVKLLKARISPEHHDRVSIQDIIDFSSEKEFALIIAPFRVFMHLLTIEEQLAALNHIHEKLIPGGQFIFDVFVPNPKYLAEGIHEVVDFEGEYDPGETLKRITSADYDLVNQLIHMAMRFEWTEKGELFNETWHFSMHLFFRYELEHLLNRTKFTETKICGDFNESPLSDDSKEFVIVCKK